MLEKGDDTALAGILVIIILVGLTIILNNFGQGMTQGAALEAASASTHLVDPSGNQPLQLDGVDLSHGQVIIRYLNCEQTATVDAIYVNNVKYNCNPPIEITCGTNNINFYDCNITQEITTDDLI
ncbi:MAG: hypothetical protein GOV15_03190, partial [Candidatus Diapherotrites archaeon]|nr:hypothetical protein [Candidatus Diapherotrites archaeon]